MVDKNDRGSRIPGSSAATPDFEQQLQQSNISLLGAENYLLQQERDTLRLQLDKYKMKSPDNGGDNYFTGSSRIDRNCSNDYERIKGACDRARLELNAVKTRQEQMQHDYETCRRECDYYKTKYKKALEENQQIQSAVTDLRNDLNDATTEKQQLELELHANQVRREAERRELNELRQLYRDNKMHDPEGLVDEIHQAEEQNWVNQYNELFERYAKHMSTDYANALKKCDLYEKELAALKKIVDEAVGEKKLMTSERNRLKHQLGQNKQQWDVVQREKIETIEKYNKMQQQLEKTSMELNREIALRYDIEKENKCLLRERNTAIDEHELVMSERAEVIREIEKLQDERESATKHIEEIEKEKKTAVGELDTLRREISCARDDRDNAIKECHDLNAKMELIQQDSLRSSSCDKISAEIEAANVEVAKYKEEAEKSRIARDWAFKDREQVKFERDSIKTLCDGLRGEREKSVGELAEMSLILDEVKRQRNDIGRECQELRELLEHRSMHGNPRMPLQHYGHTDSRDSAIDTEFLSDFFSETLDVNVDVDPSDPCFDLVAGSPDSNYPSPICVSHVVQGSSAEGKLQVSDVVLRMNNMNMVDLTRKDRKKAIQLLQSSRGSVSLVIRRRKTSRTSCLMPVNVRIPSAADLFRNTSRGLFVVQLGQSLWDSGLLIGDRITHIYGETVNDIPSEDAMAHYDTHPVHVKVLRMMTGSSTLTGGFSSDHSDMDRLSPQSRHSSKLRTVSQHDVGVQADLSEISRNNSTIRQKRSCDKDKTAWKSLFEGRERIRPRLDNVFPIEMTPHTTVKTTKVPSSGKETKASLLDRAYEKIFRRPACKGERSGGDDSLPQEERTVIAVFESVVEQYDSSQGTRSRTKQVVPKVPEKSPCGTWPKYKGSPLDSTENVLESPDKKSPKVAIRNRNSVMSLSMNTRSTPWTYTDIAIDDTDSSLTPSNGTLKSPKTPAHRPMLQPQVYCVNPTAFHTPPERRHQLSLYPQSVDVDSSSMSSSLDFATNIPSRGQMREFYPPPARPVTGTGHRAHSGLALPLASSGLQSPIGRSVSPGSTSLHGNIQSRSSRLSSINSGLSGRQPSSFEERPAFLYGDPVYHEMSGTIDSTRRPMSLNVVARTPLWNESHYAQPGVLSPGPNSTQSSSSQISVPSGSIYRDNRINLNRPVGPPLYDTVRKRPQLGQVRTVVLHRPNDEPPGMKIKNHGGGIFVTWVKELGLADKAGVVVGDQLLEVGPINLRNANSAEADKVLRNAGPIWHLQLQYRGPFPSTSDSSDLVDESLPSSAATSSDSLRGPTGTLKGSQRRSTDTMTSDDSRQSQIVLREARSIRFTKGFNESLGVNLIGGNVRGIFVHSVPAGSVASGAKVGFKGLGCGEQILEYNGINMRNLLLEKAMFELCKPVQNVTIIAQANPELYEMARATSAGDSLYVKTMWDRDKSQLQDEDLVFKRGDILFIDNTVYNGEIGLWRAWLLDENGEKVEWGVVPNRYKAEEEVHSLQQSNFDLLDSFDPQRRSARRSIFQRRKSRSSSYRRELASFSSASLGYDTFSAAPEEPLVPTYQRVSKVVYEDMRPVLILGPLSEVVVERLLQNHPTKYARCPVQMYVTGMDQTDIIEKRQFSREWDVVSAKALKEVADRNTHCMVDVSVSSVERMLALNIHPIVLVIEFRSPSVIREVRDGSFNSSKISLKAAKELFELAARMKTEHGKLITAVIPGDTSLSYMASLANNAIDAAQTRPRWILEGSVL